MKRISRLYCILIVCLFISGCGTHQNIGDGTYCIDVSLRGGSGKAGVASPASVTVSGDMMTAELVWSSPHYDYMIVDGEKYLRLNEELGIEGDSVFRIPVSALDTDISVIADTTAMSMPHEIEYTLRFDSSTMTTKDDADDGNKPLREKSIEGGDTGSEGSAAQRMKLSEGVTYIPEDLVRKDGSRIEFSNEVKRRYAQMFSIAYSDDGFYYIHIEQTGDYIIVPEGESVGNAGDAQILCKPIDDIYLVSTAAMDLFAALDEGLEKVSFCSLDKKEWYVDAAVSAFDSGTLKYAGKYSAPDYELLLSEGCGLAIENTMIYHKPEVIEKLDSLGIPVIVEASSYEPHPFGRMEWIKLYGALTDRLDEAGSIFDRELEAVEPVLEAYEKNTADEQQPDNKKSVAFFYITSNGAVSVRKSNDYVSRMIEMAGGRYVPESLKDDSNALSTINMQMESFYAEARDADILIYNGSVVGEIGSIKDLLDKDKLFADFKAVRSGNVYTTGRDLYQETMSIPMMIIDMNRIFTQEKVSNNELTFLTRLE